MKTFIPLVNDRSGVRQDWRLTQSGSLGSAGSLEDFDGDVVDGTPSPSDSGVSVAELEAQLKEKDCEIGLLRETLEQNEAVIFQVRSVTTVTTMDVMND